MFKALVWAIAALLASAGAAAAMPQALAVVVALVGNGATLYASIGALFGLSAGVSAFVGRLLVSAAISAISAAMANKQASSPQLIRQLAAMTSLPPYRYVYGEAEVSISPAPWLPKGTILYGCMIMNSRPSEGPFTVRIDDRDVEFTGDIYDFATGASASNAPFAGYLKAWIGLGDQTGPPAQILTEAGDLFSATDGWQGLTVLWLRVDAGPNTNRAERWPNATPDLRVAGKWSRVWDPRDVAQDPDDASTWTWSANQGLCTLDALRTNPIEEYRLDNLRLDLFIEAADVADEAVALKAGGTEPRYSVNGVLIWTDGELEDQITPLLVAGAARWTRAGGRLGLIPGKYYAPETTVTDLLADAVIEYRRWRPGRDLATTVECEYVSPDHDWVHNALEEYEVPGAVTADGGIPKKVKLGLAFVTSATQAMRLQKIAALQNRLQRSISCTLPPSAFDMIAGSVCTVDLAAPYDALNGIYQVASIEPAMSPTGADGGVAMRCPVLLTETSADIYAWTAATDEQDVLIPEAVSATRSPPEAPGAVTLETGAAAVLYAGSTPIPRVKFTFAPSASSRVISYEWQLTPDTTSSTPEVLSSGLIDADALDGSGNIVGYALAEAGTDYRVRVRSRSIFSLSDWQLSDAITATAPDTSIVDLVDLTEPATPGQYLTVRLPTTALVPVWGDLVWWRGTSSGTIISPARYIAIFDAAEYVIDQVAKTFGDVVALTRASTGTYRDADGLVQTAAIDATRFDYIDGEAALLVEPAAENLHTYSSQFDDASWSLVGGTTVAANAVTGPDGTSSGDTVTSGNAALQAIFDVVTVVAGETYTSSVWVKLGTMAAADFKMAVRDESNAAWIAQNIVPTVTPSASIWQRLSYVWAAPAGCTSARFAPFRNTVAVAGTFHLWNAQTELGSVATSDIVTGASAVTRAADVATMIGVTATLDLVVTYGDASTEAFAAQSVSPSYWPALTQTRVRQIVGRT